MMGLGPVALARHAEGFHLRVLLKRCVNLPIHTCVYQKPNGGLADLDAELKQFPVDAARPPQRVGFAHAADQITDFCAVPNRI
jgi:hypothetical protein